ncbi:MAG TPA: hypothetical protein VK629_00490, partial [Steroidobacteraceae bacterium]|nr:hypothetical protein [Steroidobacteraceae bacterium]
RGYERGNAYRTGQYRDGQYARVVDVDPIVRRVRVSVPQEECWNESRVAPSAPSRTEIRSTIIGGLIGAAVGHRVSTHADVSSSAAVVGGSLIGAAIGSGIGINKAERRGDYRDPAYQTVQRCEVNHREQWEEQVDGYRVTYMFNGQRYTTQMPYDPGPRLRVDVNVRPVQDQFAGNRR